MILARNPSRNADYSNIRKTDNNSLRNMKDSWLSKKEEEIQYFADRNDRKMFHDALKTVYGTNSSRQPYCLV